MKNLTYRIIKPKKVREKKGGLLKNEKMYVSSR